MILRLSSNISLKNIYINEAQGTLLLHCVCLSYWMDLPKPLM